MARRGPKPTPTRILQLRGSWRGNTRPAEPVPPPAAPAMPRWFTPEQRRIWREVTSHLETIGIIAKVDGHALQRYVVMAAQWRELEAYIRIHGACYELPMAYHAKERVDAQGETIPAHTLQMTRHELRPQVKLWLQLSDRLGKLEAAFGMTPSARASLGVELSKALPQAPHPLKVVPNPQRFLRLDSD